MVSEVFMIPSNIMGFLGKIKLQFPDIKFIMEGDPEQTRPVGQEHINWLNTPLLHNICDGNMIELTINKRSNETENYYKILNGDALIQNRYNRSPQRINICRTNAMRTTINDEMMSRTGYFIGKGTSQYSQDMWVSLDTPIMAIKTDKKLDLKNGKMYAMTSIKTDGIEINDNVYTDKEFAQYFVVAYCVTNHKVQGLTIKDKFNIYEFDKMSTREKYTAYSRCTDGKNVCIIDGKNINAKFYKSYCIYKWCSKRSNHIYIGHTNNYEERKAEHLQAVKVKGNRLYKHMRETGVDNWEMVILEEFHAVNRAEAEEKEQSYISLLNPSLNMCMAKKPCD